MKEAGKSGSTVFYLDANGQQYFACGLLTGLRGQTQNFSHLLNTSFNNKIIKVKPSSNLGFFLSVK
jgi:hypothetical protein